MNPIEEKLINSLKHHANDHIPTLQPHPIYKNSPKQLKANIYTKFSQWPKD
ncbi:hypothetical protein [Yeosuana marina]|uniref:hypothetical protein n=1 Tax=Yeosuana marina TaxID=1565536 RepID=UPI00141E754C|nr:hypothetical protein [Yeosuana marina]